MADIKNIPISSLHGHPNNPRKDIGDVTELADSIKAKGILQNLTVVPGYRMTREEFMEAAKAEGVTKAIAKEIYDADPSVGDSGNGYTVIIGHRRLAAAKLAGLKELPCAVVEMSKEDQLSTMLVENMQRSDLTLYEEAKGFQMMLDLGKTVAEVADMSGFSEATVRRRAKLAALDETKFKKAVDRGATLFDFAELDKVEDPEARDKLLDVIGKADFKNKLASEISRQKEKKTIASFAEQVSEWAMDISGLDMEWEDGIRVVTLDGDPIFISYIRNYSIYSGKDARVERPEDADTSTYFYTVSSHSVDLYKKINQEELDKLAAAEAERRASLDAHENRLGIFEEMSERHRALRFEFVKNFNQFQKKSADVWEFVVDAMVYAKRNGGGYSNNESIKELGEILGVEYNSDTHEINFPSFLEAKRQRPEQTALLTAMWILDRGDYFIQHWDAEQRKYLIIPNENKSLDALYRLLGSLGYLSSTEEVELRKGTHKLFDKVSE